MRPLHFAVATDHESAVLKVLGFVFRCRPIHSINLGDSVTGIGQDGEGKLAVLPKPVPCQFRGVGADRYYLCTQLLKHLEVVVQGEKLADTMVAMVSIVKDQYHRSLGE